MYFLKESEKLMAYNMDDFNRILADINAKIDSISADSEEKAILIESMKNAFDNKSNVEIERLEEFSQELNYLRNTLENADSNDNYAQLLVELKNFEKSFKNEIMNLSFDKNNLFESLKDEVVRIFEKNASLEKLYPSTTVENFEEIKELISENLTLVQQDINGHIKTDYDMLAQSIGALYGVIDNFKKDISANTSLDIKNISDEIKLLNGNNTGLSIKLDELMEIISNRAADSKELVKILYDAKNKADEISSQLKENIAVRIEDLKMNLALALERFDAAKEALKISADENASQILAEIQNSANLISEFKENVASDLSGYLNSIREGLKTFADDIKSAQKNFGSEYLDKKTEEFEKLCEDIKAIDTDLALKEENYKDYVNKKIEELDSFLKSLDEHISSANLNVENSLSGRIAALEELISNKSDIKDEKLDSLEKSLVGYSELLRNNFGLLGTDLLEYGNKMTSKVNTVTAVLNGISVKTDEIALNIRTSLSNQIGDLKTDIAIAGDKVDSLREEMKQTANNNISQIMTGIQNSNGQLVEFKEDVSAHFSEYLTAIKDALEAFCNDLTASQESLGSDIMNNKIEELQKLSEDFSRLNAGLASRDENFKGYVDEKINELHNYLTSFEDIISSSNPDINNLITAKISALEELISQKSEIKDEKLDNLTLKVDAVSTAVDNVSGKTDEQITNIQEIKTLINSVFEEIQKKYEDIQSDISRKKEKSHIFEGDLTTQLKELEARILDESSKHSLETSEKISEINSLISDIKSVLEYTGKDNAGILIEKLSTLDDGLNDNFAEYDRNLVTLKEKIGEYVSSAERISEDTNSKLDNSLLEIIDLKNELKNVYDKLDNSDLNKFADFEKRFDEVIFKFADIISGIDTLKTELDENVKAAMQNNVDFIDKGLEYISINLNEIKENQSGSSHLADIANNLDESITSIKDELMLINTDITHAVNEKAEVLLTEFAPLKASIEKFLDFNMSDITEEIKNQIQLSYLNLLSELNDNLNDNQETYLKIENTYKDIVEKCSSVGSAIADFTTNNFELMSSTIANIDANVSSNIDKTNSLYAEWKVFVDELNRKIVDNNREYECSLAGTLDEIDKILDEKLLLNQKDLQDYIAILLQKQNFVQLIENSNKELADKFEELKLKINEGLETGDLTEEIAVEVKKVLHDSIETLNEKFAIINEKVDIIAQADNSEIIEEISKSSENVAVSIKELHDKIAELSQDDEQTLADIASNCTDIQNSLTDLHLKVDLLNTSGYTESFDELNDYCLNIQKILSGLQSTINGMINPLDRSGTDTLEQTYEEIQKSVADLNSKMDVLAAEDNSEFQDEIFEFSEKLMTSISDLHTKVDVLAMADNSEIAGKFEDYSDKILDLVQELKSKMDEISTSKETEISEKMNEYFEKLIQAVSELHTKMDILAMSDNSDMSGQLEDYSERILDAVNELKSKVAGSSQGEVSESAENLLKSVEELHAKLDILAMSDNSDMSGQLEDYSERILDAVNELKNKVSSLSQIKVSDNTEKLGEYSEKLVKAVENLHTKIDALAGTGNSGIDEKLAGYSDKILNSVQDLKSKMSEITSTHETEITESIKDYTDKLVQSVSDLHTKVDILAMQDNTALEDTISDSSEKLMDKIDELHKKVDILTQSDNSEFQDEIVGIKELIQSQQKLLENPVDDEISAKLEDIIQTLDYSDDKIAKTLELLHNKVDVLAMADDSELREEINDIKDLIYKQKEYFEKNTDDEKSREMSSHLEKLISEINKIEKNVSEIDLEKNSQDIKDSVMTAMLSAMEQVSFVEETEEIKDFVEEKTDAINRTLLDVKRQLNNIINPGDMDFYTYTLQDVEADLAKLRLTLNELSSTSSSNNEVSVISANISRMAKSIEQLQMNVRANTSLPELKADFNKLSEDILSLSTRTNKILLNSDESQRVMNLNLRDFAVRTQKLQARLDEIDNKQIDSRLSFIEQKVNESVNTSKILQNVMIYLGEWMDGTSETISSIYDKSLKAASTHDLLETLQTSMPQLGELIKIVENRFEQQQSRIDRLEQKLEKALEMLSDYDDNTVTTKIDRIDRRLAKLTENIEKLTAYVDEE